MLPVSIVVISYGSYRYLPDCLGSLFDNLATYPQFKVALIENKLDQTSLEQAKQAARSYFSQGLRLLPAPFNLGYGGGANWGWQQQGEAAVYIVLNPDMKFPIGWLSKFVAAFERDEAIGVAGCKLLSQNGHIQHAGGLVRHGLALAEHFGAGEPDDGRWNEGCEVEFVTGAALGLSRRAFETLQGFDPHYFPGYYEDIDLCRRARQAGFKVWYEGNASAFHFEGGAFGRAAGYYRPLHRNRLKFALRHFTTAQLVNQFIPAERLRLQGTLEEADRRACLAVYSAAASSFIRHIEKPMVNQVMKKTTSEQPRVAVTELYNPDLENDNQAEAERLQQLAERLAEVKKGWLVQEKPFHSKLPLVATLRERFNSLSTRWYVKPILAQQVDYNAAVSRAVEDLGQLALSGTAASNMQTAVLAARMLVMEERLERIEGLLERLSTVPPPGSTIK